MALPEPLTETMGLVVPVLVRLGQHDLVRSIVGGTHRLGLATRLHPFVNHPKGLQQVLLVTLVRIALAPIDTCRAGTAQSIDPWRRLTLING